MLKQEVNSSTSQQHGGEARAPSISISEPELRKKCYFLDVLPTELRVAIYKNLVVSPSPLRGKTARKANEVTELDLTILRVNRQINIEALSLFYGKNTFYITSIPDIGPPLSTPAVPAAITSPTSDEASVSEPVRAFDPPIPFTHWPLIRHLTINLIYLPAILITRPSNNSMGWRPVSPSGADYISLLVSMLQRCTPTLLSLSLVAEIPTTYCAKRCLVTFFMCDLNHDFASTIAGLSVDAGGKMKSIGLAFEFPDCYLRMSVQPGFFVKKSILTLACQVVFGQSQVRVKNLLEDYEKGNVTVEGGKVKMGMKVDLAPFVETTWGAMGAAGGELL